MPYWQRIPLMLAIPLVSFIAQNAAGAAVVHHFHLGWVAGFFVGMISGVPLWFVTARIMRCLARGDIIYFGD